MFVTKIFTFDSAHNLTNYYGKCERVHGHTYSLEVTLEGEVQNNGLLLDFVLLKRIVKKQVLEKLDHQYLNDIIENPSAERIVQWIWEQLKDLPGLLQKELEDPNMDEHIKKLLQEGEQKGNLGEVPLDSALRLHEIVLWENPTSKVTYHG